ncbi:MAG TPA: hypothetical protein PKY96_06630 [Flavobacteriales bacterium]|nr:hypothetical protein [Flavobacteriales bacterium]
MRPLVYMFYHGDVDIEYWEWLGAVVYLAIIFFVFIRRRNKRMREFPEYRYYLTGVYAKLFGAMFFSLIYFYYYPGGDTTAYYYSALAMRNLAFADPQEYLRQLMGDNSMRAWLTYSEATAKPYQYVFFDKRTFAVLQATSVLAIFTFKSYLITSLVTATISFYGAWKCYRTFVSYFPSLAGKLAIGFLFMPSAVFWGSGILKDTYAFSAVGLWVHAVDEVFFKRRNMVSKSILIVISASVMLWFKPYIFMAIMPCSLIWISYFRVVRIRSIIVRFVLLPIAAVAMFALSLYILTKLSTSMDKFALDGALETIQVTQSDLSNERSYGAHRFDLGKFDGTWWGVLKKFPIATNAALFRPYVWEARTAVMMLSGLENLWVLLVAMLAVIRAGPFFTLRAIGGVPVLLMAVLFSLLFAFMVGVTTPNFGALVRFKIPMVPFFISSLYIVVHLGQIKRALRRKNIEFDIRRYRLGTGAASEKAVRAKAR